MDFRCLRVYNTYTLKQQRRFIIESHPRTIYSGQWRPSLGRSVVRYNKAAASPVKRDEKTWSPRTQRFKRAMQLRLGTLNYGSNDLLRSVDVFSRILRRILLTVHKLASRVPFLN